MKLLLISLLFLFHLSFCHAQNKPASSRTAGGVVSISLYLRPYDSHPPEIIPDSDQNYFNKYVYYIKGEKVYRDDLKDQEKAPDDPATTSTSTGMQLTLKVSFTHPRYLIDLQRLLAYTYSGPDTAYVDSLKDLTPEPFYRILFVKRTVTIDSLSETTPISIGGRTCYKAYVTIITGKVPDHSTFYYTKDHINLHSPLNELVPPTFPYTIIASKGNAPYTDENGKTRVGTGFVKSSIKEYPLADSVFPHIQTVLTR